MAAAGERRIGLIVARNRWNRRGPFGVTVAMNSVRPSRASLLVALLVLSACGSVGGSPAASDGPEDPSASPDAGGGAGGGIEHPTGSDEAILVVDSVGGFVPVDFLVTQVPSFALFGDGRVVMMGMQTLEFPGPALPALIERKLTEDGIQAILEAVEASGQFGSSRDLRGAANMVADAADTRFTVNAGGREVTVSVYGLGLLMPGMEVPDMPAGEAEAHEALSALNDQLLMIDTWLPADAWATEGWHPYEPTAFRLYVRDVTNEPVDGDLPEHVMDWPTDDDPAGFGVEQPFFGNGTRCGTVEGEDWLVALSEATQSTRWTDDGERRFTVAPRPLLPHEEVACPDLAAS